MLLGRNVDFSLDGETQWLFECTDMYLAIVTKRSDVRSFSPWGRAKLALVKDWPPIPIPAGAPRIGYLESLGAHAQSTSPSTTGRAILARPGGKDGLPDSNHRHTAPKTDALTSGIKALL